MGLADAVVAVPFHLVAGVPVMQIDVGGAVRVGTGTELRQVTGVTGLSTRGTSRFELCRHTSTGKNTVSRKGSVLCKTMCNIAISHHAWAARAYCEKGKKGLIFHQIKHH